MDIHEVTCRNPVEAHWIWRELQEGQYAPAGIRLWAGMRVVDVGAHIGLFTLWVAQQLGGDVAVLAAEPCADSAALAQSNWKAHGIAVQCQRVAVTERALALALAESGTENMHNLAVVCWL